MSQVIEFDDDLVAVDRRQDVRIIVSIPGRYSLANRRDATGNRCEFACRMLNISPRAMALAGPVSGAVGDRVITHFDEFGKMEGQIFRVLDRSFIMTIAANEEERGKLSVKIQWYEMIKNHDQSDNRKDRRIIPKNPHSVLLLPDGSQRGCFVIDMSASGVAVSADVTPPIGTPVAIGKVVGRVVRRFADGFAIHFTESQAIELLEQKIIQG